MPLHFYCVARACHLRASLKDCILSLQDALLGTFSLQTWTFSFLFLFKSYIAYFLCRLLLFCLLCVLRTQEIPSGHSGVVRPWHRSVTLKRSDHQNLQHKQGWGWSITAPLLACSLFRLLGRGWTLGFFKLSSVGEEDVRDGLSQEPPHFPCSELLGFWNQFLLVQPSQDTGMILSLLCVKGLVLETLLGPWGNKGRTDTRTQKS